MTLISTTVGTGVATAGACGQLMQGRVDGSLLSELRSHGMDCPIRSIHDPRLEYPELLITSGWDRVDVKDGWGYRMEVDRDSQGDVWSQYYEQHDDGSSMLQTQAGHQVQTIKENPNGSVTTLMQKN